MIRKNFMNIFDITAKRTRQVKDGTVSDIEDLYACKSDIQEISADIGYLREDRG